MTRTALNSSYYTYNFAAGHLAVYSYELSTSRILAHYEAGATGWQGVSAAVRFGQILTWARLGLKRGGWVQQPGDGAGGDHADRPCLQPVRAAGVGRDLQRGPVRGRPVQGAGQRVPGVPGAGCRLQPARLRGALRRHSGRAGSAEHRPRVRDRPRRVDRRGRHLLAGEPVRQPRRAVGSRDRHVARVHVERRLRCGRVLGAGAFRAALSRPSRLPAGEPRRPPPPCHRARGRSCRSPCPP